MNILPRCFVLIVCFVYYRLTSSQSLEPDPIEKLHQVLLDSSDIRAYKTFLKYSIPEASSGKNLFKMTDSLGEDCIRTAKVIVQSYIKPSINARTVIVMFQSYIRALNEKANSSFQKKVNATCEYLNEEVKKYPSVYPNFQELKSKVELPKPVKNYINEIPFVQNITKDWLFNIKVALENADDRETIKYEIVKQFHRYKTRPSDENGLDFRGTARAVTQLSQNATLKSTVDSTFVEALEDYIEELFQPNTDRYVAIYTPEFVKKVDQYFLKNSVLKDEYKIIKKQIIDEKKNTDFNE
ncbi:hypothetical protein V9T40_005966 [Parthenolecanium corni]|uniref:Uncharacterized protein n=1 Tax=Parthenolecanium corni TaxID=536013 RepID=A0AAN9TXH3_9HEMI